MKKSLKRPIIFSFLVVFAVFAAVSVAAPFSITNRTSDIPSGNAIFTALSQTADSLEATVNSGFLSDSSRSTFNEAVAKASSSPGSGLWVDRASDPKRLYLGVGAQAQVNMASLNLSALNFKTDNSLPAIGGGASVIVSLGVSPSLLRLKNMDRMFLYLTGMYYSSQIAQAQIQSAQIGLNGQYRIIAPKSLIVIGWGGITAATGINYSSNFVGLNSQMQVSSSTDVSGETVLMNMDLKYQLGVRSSVITIPLEISTNVSILYLFTLFLGGGADLNFGSASLSGTASGPVTATYSGAFSGANLFSGTGTINLDDGVVSRPSAVVGRAFAGVQFSVWMLKAATTYTYLTNQTHGISFIARLAL